jgi:hypothetical protein
MDRGLYLVISRMLAEQPPGSSADALSTGGCIGLTPELYRDPKAATNR